MFTRRNLATALTLTVLSSGAVAADQEINFVDQANTLVSKAFDETQRDLSLGVTFDVLEATEVMDVKDANTVLMAADNSEKAEKAIITTDNNDA